MNFASLTSLTIPEGAVSQITGSDGKVLWSSMTFDPVFTNNTWKQIIKACKNNVVPETWVVGDQKAMEIGGVDYTIVIIGKEHDSDYDGNIVPLTFQMLECLNTKYQLNDERSNDGGWPYTFAYMGDLYDHFTASLPAEVKAGLRTDVVKRTSLGNKSTEIEETGNDIFLLSVVEVFGTTSAISVAGEGTQYEYYAAENSKIKHVNGDKENWWLRSPCKSNATQYCRVTSSGASSASYADAEGGISYAFCF